MTSTSPGAPEKLQQLLSREKKKKERKQDYLIAGGGATSKSDMHTMQYPFFSLCKKPDKTIRKYQFKRNKEEIHITLTPSVKGHPTIWDADILHFCAAEIVARGNAGEPVSEIIRTDCHSMLFSLKRSTGGQGYIQLVAALERLAGTQVRTTIRTGGRIEDEGFSLIQSWRVTRTSRAGHASEIEIVLSRWIYRSFRQYEVLTINDKYYELRGGVERRLYLIARKHCGNQAKDSPPMRLSTLHERCGTSSPLKHFRWQVRAIVKDNNIPDYVIQYCEGDMVQFYYQPLSAIEADSPE